LRVEAAESALIELSGSLERKFRSDAAYHYVVVALGLRARSLFGGFVHAMDGPWPVSGLALMRPLVEINILLRFLRQSPDVRARLWIAERHRWALAVVGDITKSSTMRAKWVGELPGDETLAAWRSEVDDTRREARELGVPGVPDKGPLIPTIAEQVRLLNDEAATEAYVFAYRRFSGDVHGGVVSFDRLAVDESRGDGWLSMSDNVSTDELYSTRVLALTTFASTVRLASDALDLSIGEAADRIKDAFMRARSEDDGSQSGSADR
jgi:hypothetical protein